MHSSVLLHFNITCQMISTVPATQSCVTWPYPGFSLSSSAVCIVLIYRYLWRERMRAQFSEIESHQKTLDSINKELQQVGATSQTCDNQACCYHYSCWNGSEYSAFFYVVLYLRAFWMWLVGYTARIIYGLSYQIVIGFIYSFIIFQIAKKLK